MAVSSQIAILKIYLASRQSNTQDEILFSRKSEFISRSDRNERRTMWAGQRWEVWFKTRRRQRVGERVSRTGGFKMASPLQLVVNDSWWEREAKGGGRGEGWGGAAGVTVIPNNWDTPHSPLFTCTHYDSVWPSFHQDHATVLFSSSNLS